MYCFRLVGEIVEGVVQIVLLGDFEGDVVYGKVVFCYL